MYSINSTPNVTPRQFWHRGELAIHEKLGVASAFANGCSWLRDYMPEQHRIFHTSKLSFIPLTTLEHEHSSKQRRPWVSLITPRTDRSEFVSSPDEHTLVVDIAARAGDPIIGNIRAVDGGDDSHLAAGLGIEWATRRRNKFAGSMHVDHLTSEGDDYRMVMTVNQAIGNCPKYITVRDLVPDTSPARTMYDVRNMSKTDQLPDELVSFIHRCDTIFLGTSYEATEQESKSTPSHVGVNHRGGRPGFVRVRNDKRTIVVPDYSGNRLYSSLGNIEASSLAAVSFVSFDTGDILYLTGEATNFTGPAAQAIMPSQETLSTLHITGYIFVASALPLRHNPTVSAERSPYSPPIKLLAEERHDLLSSDDAEAEDIFATLSRVTVYSPTLATLQFTLSRPIRAVRPGQAAIMDFSGLMGRSAYAHMNEDDPQALNDERVRTWTVSDADIWHDDDAVFVDDGGGDGKMREEKKTSTVSLTMREKKRGLITGMLFRAIRKLQDGSSTSTGLDGSISQDATSLGISAKLVGVGGDFVVSSGAPSSGGLSRTNACADDLDNHERFLWIAGGIGITPFLAMLSSFVRSPGANAPEPEKDHRTKNIHFVLSTREPDILLSLISQALTPYPLGPDQVHRQDSDAANSQTQISLLIDIFAPPDTTYDINSILAPPTGKPRAEIEVCRHTGRVAADFFVNAGQVAWQNQLENTRVYLCGPHGFENDMMNALESAGYHADRVVRENFDY